MANKPSTKTSTIETKSENKQAVLRYIQKFPASTRQDLYVGLGLSLPTIKQAIEYLLTEGWIMESDTVKNTGGRNAAAYSLRSEGRYAVGIYLSANHISGVSVDLNGNILYKERIRMKLSIRDDAYLKEIAALADHILQQTQMNPDAFTGIGIAVPSLISEDGERIIHSMALDFQGATRETISRYIPHPTRLFHDSDTAAFAEVQNRRQTENAFYINLNNTVGGAVIQNGSLYHGDHFRSGEIGHMIIHPRSQKLCYCGQYGCLNTLTGAGNLDSLTDGNLQEFFNLLAQKNPKAVTLWETYLDDLAVAIHNIRMLYDCSIILGGYVGAYIEPYLEDLYKRVDRLSIFDDYAREYVLPCRYQNEATAAGAAMQMMEAAILAM